jgi:hypothetical protein
LKKTENYSNEKRIKERLLPQGPQRTTKHLEDSRKKNYSIFESEEKTNNQGVSKRPAKTPTTIVI